ncbi:MAG: 2-polyprenyl-3-methyl-6-methoxy-1,4-benzoquinone monooxygenase [Gammaproteobacteria bacterium AqS3]|nr:2-polyprenyl-3-methyl-6-methoxy-1,4-benzoquinone monooxygenase [Gammaproteobacteria bacterium AqS3]
MLDSLIGELDRALRICGGATLPSAPEGAGAYPAEAEEDGNMSERDRALSIRLMRVNHAGEIAAQALYRGQACSARKSETRTLLRDAADDEVEHLRWCRARLDELGGATSVLDPLWYAGAFVIGCTAGCTGDAGSLGFVRETERQVAEHLRGHLDRLPEGDARSRALIRQMRSDEIAHGDAAKVRGGAELPAPARQAMHLAARVMTTLAARI